MTNLHSPLFLYLPSRISPFSFFILHQTSTNSTLSPSLSLSSFLPFSPPLQMFDPHLTFTFHSIPALIPFTVMTTGGGWQDQIGAVYGGFKIARSASSLPVRVSVQPIPTTPGEQSDHRVFITQSIHIFS